MQGDIKSIKERQNYFKGLVPEDWKAQLDELKNQVKSGVGEVGSFSKEVMNGGVAGMQERVKKLENYVNDITESNGMLNAMMQRLNYLYDSEGGQKQMEMTTRGLLSYLSGSAVEQEQDIDKVLDKAVNNDPAVSQTFNGVPKQDLKAAALLFSLTQLRYALNRDKVPFDDDLKLAMKLVGNDDPELNKAIENLTPQAKEGVFTPSHLAKEFSGLAGDVVVSSLKGEDVSISDKAKARFNNIFQLEKDGELLTGTKTQAKLNKAKNFLDKGDVAGALKILNTMNDQEKEPLKEWMDKAQTTIKVQEVESMLKKAINLTTGQGLLGGSSPLGKKRQSLKKVVQ